MSSQPPKDFLALSHGHEWVDFYESFDKLVQDHLSRSSELLRKAMSLPEVADREVAQVRDDLESQLTTERAQNQATLNSLRAEISSSHQQVASLAQIVGSLMANLDRLGGSVDAAMAKAASAGDVPAAIAPAESSEAAQVANAPAPPEWVAEPVAVQENDTAEEPAVEGVDWASLTDEARGESADEIDLSALAAMEESTPESSEDESSEAETAAAGSGSDRVRPHWLSMSRSGQ
jgi:predicted ribosome quality control (RQC) complex YloA/Tae2 family protein